MDDRQWQAALNVYGSTRSRKHKIELEAMLRKGWQAKQAELEQARAQVNILREFIEQDNPRDVCSICTRPREECQHCYIVEKLIRRTEVLAATTDAQEVNR